MRLRTGILMNHDRIKLAQAIGESTLETRFDPFTNANDDYVVLEWFREKEKPKHSAEWCEFWMDLNHGASYLIGDYAKAALKVIDRD